MARNEVSHFGWYQGGYGINGDNYNPCQYFGGPVHRYGYQGGPMMPPDHYMEQASFTHCRPFQRYNYGMNRQVYYEPGNYTQLYFRSPVRRYGYQGGPMMPPDCNREQVPFPNRRPPFQQYNFGMNHYGYYEPGNYARCYFRGPLIPPRIKGIIKWFNVKSGYGFIIREDTNADIFVHKTEIVRNNMNKHFLPSVSENEKVEFEVVEGKKGFRAVNVTRPNGTNVQGSRYSPDHRHDRPSGGWYWGGHRRDSLRRDNNGEQDRNGWGEDYDNE